MRGTCPRGHQIQTGDINFEQGVALCRECQSLYPAADVGVSRRTVDALAAARQPPPPGCTRVCAGDETRLSASARWLPMGLVVLAVALCWTGFFAYQVDSQIHDLRAAVWGPQAPGDPTTRWLTAGGHAVFALFLTLFLLVGVALLGAGVTLLAGRVEVRLAPAAGRVFSGVWRIGRTRRFDPHVIEDVRVQEHVTSAEDGQSRHYTIRLVTNGKPLDFGRILREPQLNWLAGSVHAELVRDQPEPSIVAS